MTSGSVEVAPPSAPPAAPAALWPAVLGVAVFGLALWAQTSAAVGVFYDDGIYVTLAKSLAEGRGYRYLHIPGTPPGVHYPILYPAALALLWRMWPSFPANVALFQLFDAAALGGAAWAIASHARRWQVSRFAQYLALPLGFTAFPLLAVVGVRFSEPLFLLLFAAAVLVADRDRSTTGDAVLGGVLAGLAALTRTVGLAVVIGVVAGFWVRKQRRAAVLALLAAVVTFAPWPAWVAMHSSAIDPRIGANYGTYLDEAHQAGLLGALAGLDLRAFGPLTRLALPQLVPWLFYPIAVLLVGVIVCGAIRVGRVVPALVIALVFYMGAVILWPYAPDRFIWILAPWAALAGFAGAGALWRTGNLGKLAVVILVIVATVGYARRNLVSLTGRRFAVTAEEISTSLRWLVPAIRSSTPDGAVIATEGEAAIYLYTGRQAVPSHLFSWSGRGTRPLGADVTIGYFCDAGVSFVARSGREFDAAPVMAQLISRADSVMSPVFEVANGPALYRFRCPR